MKIKLLLFLLLIWTMTLNSQPPNLSQHPNLDALDKEHSLKQIRWHQFLDTNFGVSLEYTTIGKFERNDLGLVDTSYNIVLVDLGDMGKWIFKSTSKLDRSNEERLCLNFTIDSFTLVESGEKLEIRHNFDNPPCKRKGTEIISYPNKKKMNFQDEQASKESFDLFLKDNFSKSFVSGFLKLIEIADKCEKNGYAFSIKTDGLLPPFTVEPNKDALNFDIDENKIPATILYNCDFDAKFGYPCTEDEKPAKNKNVLVKEKK